VEFGRLWEISVSPLTKLIMDVPTYCEANRLKAFRIKAIGRRIEEQRNDQYVLREEPVAYNSVFDPAKGLLSSENSC